MKNRKLSNRKLRGGSNPPPITRLKSLARSDSRVRDKLWVLWDDPKLTIEALIARIDEEYGVRLNSKNNVTELYSWLMGEMKSLAITERQSQAEAMNKQLVSNIKVVAQALRDIVRISDEILRLL